MNESVLSKRFQFGISNLFSVEMKWLLGIIFLYLTIVRANCECTDDEMQVVCYWGSWSVYREDIGKFKIENIDTSLCTKVVYTFIGLNINLDIATLDDNLDITLGGFSNFTKLNNEKSCLKKLVAIGGWNEGSVKYSVMAATEERRKKFAENVLRFLIYYGFDGLDLDWEYPTARGGIPADGENFVALLKVVKETIKPWGLTLSVAVAIDESLINTGYIVSEIANAVDNVHLMAYDYISASSSVTGLNSPMSAIENSVSLWLKGGLPAKKLILGLPAYARNFVLKDPHQHGLGAPVADLGIPGPYTKQNGFLAYFELLDIFRIDEMAEVRSDGTMYAFSEDEWITYENEETVELKTKFAIEQNLGGMMLWSLDTDDFRGTFGKKFPLLNTINKVIKENKSKN